MSKKPEETSGIQLISDNRKARFNYQILDTLEAGVELLGSEVKSLRERNINFTDAYAIIQQGEVFVIGMKIEPYKQATHQNHESDRTRKLLLHRKEIDKLQKEVQIKKISLIPLKIYFKEGRVKILLGKGIGKSKGDKRETIKKREGDVAIGRAMKRGNR